MTDIDALAVVLLERLRTQRLPRALDIQKKLDDGHTLADYDIAFLEEALADAKRLLPYSDRDPEYQSIAARVVHLYHEITTRALTNETAAGSPGGGPGA